jgi:hypothetical protein
MTFIEKVRYLNPVTGAVMFRDAVKSKELLHIDGSVYVSDLTKRKTKEGLERTCIARIVNGTKDDSELDVEACSLPFVVGGDQSNSTSTDSSFPNAGASSSSTASASPTRSTSEARSAASSDPLAGAGSCYVHTSLRIPQCSYTNPSFVHSFNTTTPQRPPYAEHHGSDMDSGMSDVDEDWQQVPSHSEGSTRAAASPEVPSPPPHPRMGCLVDIKHSLRVMISVERVGSGPLRSEMTQRELENDNTEVPVGTRYQVSGNIKLKLLSVCSFFSQYA